jgi:hypothetical protein
MAQIDRTAGLVGNTGIKGPCACATTANITLNGEQTIDGILTSGSRVLVRAQTNGVDNGIYDSDSGAWTRTKDWNGSRDVAEGTLINVSRGTVYANTVWKLATLSPVIGTSSLSFTLYSALGSPNAARVVGSIALLKALDKTQHNEAFVTGYSTQGDGGGGPYYYDSSDTTSADNGGTIIVATDSGRWKLAQNEPATLAQFGAVLDGVTDDSTKTQAWIDAQKGKRLVHRIGVALIAGVSLNGATYDGTEIICEGGEFKLKADAGASTYGGAWVGLLVKDCDRVTLDIKANGNRAAMTAREQIFFIGIAGASNVTIPEFTVREIRGDGIYIGQSDWLSNTTNPSNINIGKVRAINTADDGRNAVSVIAVTGLIIESIYSRKVGGIIGGTTQPGGLDIEPDFGYQSCTDIVIGEVNVETAGTSGLAVLGVAITNDATRDWNCRDIRIGNALVKKTGTSGSGLAASTFARVRDLEVFGSISYATTKGKGFSVDYADRVRGRLTARNVTQGISLGQGNELRDFDLQCFVSDYDTAGVRTCSLTRGKLTGRVYGSNGTAFAVQCHDEARGGITQAGVTYAIDAPYDGNNARAFRNEPANTVAYSSCQVRDCDWTGYANPPATWDAQIPKIAVRGANYATAIPSNGEWVAADFVANSAPSEDGNQMIQFGWIRLTTGTGNVAGTDWEYVRTSTVSPAV